MRARLQRLARQLLTAAVLLCPHSVPDAVAVPWEAVTFAALHSAELRRNHLLVEFSTPGLSALGDARDMIVKVSLLYSQELLFSTGGGAACSVVIAGRGLVLRDCVLGPDRRSIELRLHTPLQAGTDYVLELQAENSAAAGLRRCVNSSSASVVGYLVKTGGRLDQDLLPGNLSAAGSDRCCRQDAASCHAFADAAACEAGKQSISCLACAVSLGDLGCPESDLEVAGYVRRREDVECLGLSPHGVVPDVSACAAACSASVACAAFTVDASGVCLLTSSDCCPGAAQSTGLAGVGALSYYAVGLCDPAMERWHASLSLRWQTLSGAPAEYTSSPRMVQLPGDTRGLILPTGSPTDFGHIAGFGAALLPDLGLIYNAAGVPLTIQLNFILGVRGEAPGDTLLFVPLPVSPWDFGVPNGTLLWQEDANSSARVVFDDMPESLTCQWHRISGNIAATGGANSILCKVGAQSAGALGAHGRTLVLSLPGPGGTGFATTWALYLESTRFASLASDADSLGFAPAGQRIRLLASSVRVPDARVVLQVAFVLGLLAERLTLVVRLPTWVLADVSACGPVLGWPFPATVAAPVLDGSACQLEEVTTGNPSTEYRMRLVTSNRGVAPGTKGLLTLRVQWASRSEMVSSEDFYNLVEPFPAASATMALGVQGVAGPLVLTLRTAASVPQLYEGCQKDAAVQFSLMRPDVLSILSATGGPLVVTPEPVDCGRILLEVYSDDPDGFPVPSGCRWDSMTKTGDLLTISFGTASGFPGLQSGREYTFVFFAEPRGLGAVDGVASLAVVALCGQDAAESAELQVAGPGAVAFRSLARRALGATLGLQGGAAAGAASGTFSLELLATGLFSASTSVQKVRLFAFPLLGFGFVLAQGGTTQVKLEAWWNAAATGPADAEMTVQGQVQRLGGSYAEVACVEVAIPGAWQAQLAALRVALSAVTPASSGLGWTGFAAHPYVFMEIVGQDGQTEFGEVLQLAQVDTAGWLRRTPSLQRVELRAGSQVGGAQHRVDVFLSLGFRAEGIVVTITPPLGMALVDSGTGVAPAAVTFNSSRGHLVRYPILRIDANGTVYSGRRASFTASSGTFWPAATYLCSLYILNPERLMDQLEWSLSVEFAGGFPVSTGVSPPTTTVQAAIAVAQGAFAVVRALQSCSVTPASMLLGAGNMVRVSFTLPVQSDSVLFVARPFLMTLLAPKIFTVRTPVVFRALRNLPPATEVPCDTPSASQMRCQLPEGFTFVADAAYAFEVLIDNPIAVDFNYAALQAQYSPGWALQLAYSQPEATATTALYSLCEDLPRALVLGTNEGRPSFGPFPLYDREMAPLFFRVSIGDADLLPLSISGRSVAVVVTFRPASPQLPTGTVLLATAPLGWAWVPGGSVEGRAVEVLQGATRDFPAQLAPQLGPRPPNQIAMQCERAIQGGQVYGFRTLIEVPNSDSDKYGNNITAANVWTLELLHPDAQSSLVHQGRFDAVVNPFEALKVRVVSGCAVLPLALEAGRPAEIVMSFQLTSHLGPGDYIWIRTPPHFSFSGEEPCESYLEPGVPLLADLSHSGLVYPDYRALPAAVSCSWRSAPGAESELRLQNNGSVILRAQACLISFRVRLPQDGQETSAAQASHRWRVGSTAQDGSILDAPCLMERPFRLVSPQRALVTPSILDARWTSPKQPLLLVGFSLQAAVPAPAVFTLRAPFGSRFSDSHCGRLIQLAPVGAPPDYVDLARSSSTSGVQCVTGGGHTGLPNQLSFAPAASQPAPLLEGTLSFHVPGLSLNGATKYGFGILVNVPPGAPWRNSWHMDVSGHVGSFPGWDLLSITDAQAQASFLGLAIDANVLPYNDVAVSFTPTASVVVADAALILKAPLDFHLSSIQDIVCRPFTNFSVHSTGDVCELVGINASLGCLNGECVRIRPSPSASGEAVWLEKAQRYAVTIRVQNPKDCVSCSAPWSLRLLTRGLTFTADAAGLQLVGDVQRLHVVPTHRLGGVQVLLDVEVVLTGRLLVHDRLEFTVPSGWRLDPAFCASPPAQAAVVGLQAPPSCTEGSAVLTVYETDLPPLIRPTIRFSLASSTPSFMAWRAEREAWLQIFKGSSAPPLPPPLEFALVVRRVGEAGQPGTTAAAAKTQAYDLLPNLGPGLQLLVSSSLLSTRAAMLVSFVPSEEVDILANSVLLRASLPYGFGGCRLLWEEPPDRRATRDRNHPVFMFSGEPRCKGTLYEATLLGVLLNTTNKAQVTLYVANITTPPPPYVAARSIWEVRLQRLRAGRPAEPLDTALGVEGPGSFGKLSLVSMGGVSVTSAGGLNGFVSNLAGGAVNMLSFRLLAAVPPLAGSSVRVVAPPLFGLLPETFLGVSRHFSRRPAASDLRLERRVPLEQLRGPGAAGAEVDVLHIRVLEDSLLGEELHFEVAVSNPDSALPPEAERLNRWIVETVDETSGVATNSNRMTWLSFVPKPGFNTTSVAARDSVRVGMVTVVDIVLGVDGTVLIPLAPSQVVLEVLAPTSFKFPESCLGQPGAGTALSVLPFASSCKGVGRFARVAGVAPQDWPEWRAGAAYELALIVGNGNSTATENDEWTFQLYVESATAVAEANPVPPVTIGPAEALVTARMRSWAPPLRDDTGRVVSTPPAFALLREGTRILAVDPTWPSERGLSASAREVVVLLPEGVFGALPVGSVRNAPADDVFAPSTSSRRQLLVRLSTAPGYDLVGADAAVGYGASVPGLAGLFVVAAVKIAMPTTLSLAGLRLSAPPHFTFNCSGLVAGNLPPGSLPQEPAGVRALSAADGGGTWPLCREFRDAFASSLLLELSEATWRRGYRSGVTWWFAAPALLAAPSGWTEERQSWEAELILAVPLDTRTSANGQEQQATASFIDTVGDARFVVNRFAWSPRVGAGASLLYFRAAPTYEGAYGATYISLSYAIRITASGESFSLTLQAPRSVPFARELFSDGECVQDPDDLLFPSDGRLGSESQACSTVRVQRTEGGAAGDEVQVRVLPADATLPQRYEVADRVAVRLRPECRPPFPPCSDFFGVALGGEQLHARSNEIARQIATGQIGRDVSAAGPRAWSLVALRMVLALVVLGAALFPVVA